MSDEKLILRYTPFNAYEDSIVKELEMCTKEEDVLKTSSEISQCINRKMHVIIQRGFQLGILPYKGISHWLLSHRENGWRSDEIDLLIAYPNESRRKLALVLGRSLQSVSKQCFELKLNNGGFLYEWSRTEIQMLKAEYKELSVKEIENTLGRCRIDIRHKMLKLELINKDARIQFTGRPKTKFENNLCEMPT